MDLLVVKEDIYEHIGTIVGTLAIFYFFALSPQQKTKKKVLIFQSFSSVLYAIHYVLLCAFSAAVTNTIGLIKNLVFYDYTKKDKKIPLLVLVSFCAIIIL